MKVAGTPLFHPGSGVEQHPAQHAGVLAWGPGVILLTVLWARWFKVQENR